MIQNNNRRITVITVAFNESDSVRYTIESVINQTYGNIEYIVIDGGSLDGTLNILSEYIDDIDLLVSEKDNGVYDAMNKGLNLATGEWVIFMNAGDAFFDNDVLSNLSCEFNEADLIYSDILFSNGKIFECEINKDRIVHQALIYKKKLHKEFGLYVVNNNITASDFFFFMLCRGKTWKKVNFIIAKFTLGGASSNIEHFKQKIAIQILFGRLTAFKSFFVYTVHFFYNNIKRLFL